MIAAVWQNDLRHWLFVINVVVFVVLVIFVARAVLSPRKARKEGEHLPANQTPFLPDEDLEGRRLERVQGWALLFAAVIAIALPIYWLREPTRQTQSATYFDKNSINRGAVLFARPGTENYNAAVSKQCANCHGDKGEGGTATARINGIQVAWKAPPLNTEALRFTEDKDCADPSAIQPTTICEITQIITYGRPGTPMQGWGVAGGGPLNDQSIADLVAYIESIQLTPKEAQAQATKALEAARSTDANVACPEYVSCPAIAVAQAEAKLASDRTTLESKAADAKKALGLPATTTDAELAAQCKTLEASVPSNPTQVSDELRKKGTACREFDTASQTVADDEEALAWAREWQRRRANVSDGQILFETYCARCHTEGWSVFDPTAPPSAVDGVSILGLSGGGGGQGGGTGFNLRDGGELRRFGSDESGGWQSQVDFVSAGSNPNQPYGLLGLGSGKMPGFGQMMTQDQIGAIVSYERYCLEATNYNGVSEPCATPPQPRTPPSSTTTAPAKG